MTHYIDKDALVAKIDDWRHNIMMGVYTIPLHGRQSADAAFEYEILGLVRDFLDNLEVKEVGIDFAKELVSYHNEHFSPCEDGTLLSEETGQELSWNDYQQIAEHFYTLGLVRKGK